MGRAWPIEMARIGCEWDRRYDGGYGLGERRPRRPLAVAARRRHMQPGWGVGVGQTSWIIEPLEVESLHQPRFMMAGPEDEPCT